MRCEVHTLMGQGANSMGMGKLKISHMAYKPEVVIIHGQSKGSTVRDGHSKI